MGTESHDAPESLPPLPLEPLVCNGCGRSLENLRVATCPYCGRPVGPGEQDEPVLAAHPPASRAPTQTDTGGPIPAEWALTCVHCGYCLTGLETRVCPECGHPFHPRKTWLANRFLPIRRREIRRTVLALVVLAVWALGAYFFPLWLVPLPLWLIAEMVYLRWDWNPFMIRVVFLPLYVVWMLLAVALTVF